MGKFFASNLTVLSKSLEKSTVELIVEDDMKREREVLHPFSFFVASPGIEPGSGASETLILSIVLRGQ